MPSRRTFRKTNRSKRTLARSYSRGTTRFKRRSSFGARRFSRGRGLFRSRFRGGNTHKRLSRQVIKSFFPDIAKSKLSGHHIWTGIVCNDLSSALAFGQGTTTSNTITIRMNANPNGGQFYYQPGTDIPSTDKLNPIDTYITRYRTYRPMGCKVTVTIFSQDAGLGVPDDPAANQQIASPFMLYGFPCVIDTSSSFPNFANIWSGAPSSGFTADTIPQMKYGFRRISPGLGGKNMIKYSTYWDFAKIVGLTKDQYMSNTQYFVTDPTDNTVNPPVPIMLVLALADYTPAVARQCTVDIKITQYGRWEGQQLLFD